jgi:PIN domain nuclease of toxin-antitoxin system
MRVLLDTHILLWAVGDPAKLPREARETILDPVNEILFSAASIWEIAIKTQVRRRDFAANPAEVAAAAIDSDFHELPVRAQHGALTARLPMHHRDPFDRILIAQAMTEPVRLVTVDAKLGRYSELVRVV